MQPRGSLSAGLEREATFTRMAWGIGIRPNQRLSSQLREITFEFPLLTRDVVYVHCGHTAVTACVTCELVEPSPIRPKHGFLDFSVDQNFTDREPVHYRTSLSGVRTTSTLGVSGCSADRRQLVLLLEKVIKTGGVLDTESLCALPGQRVWSIRVAITVMNDDGNVADAVVWAALAALRNFRRPELTLRGDDVIIHPPHERNPVPLSIHHTPLPITFAVTSAAGGAASLSTASSPTVRIVGAQRSPLEIVADPSGAEPFAASTHITVVVNGENQVCGVYKGEGNTVGSAVIRQCIDVASKLVPKLLSCLEESMVAHEQRRMEALKGQFLWATKRSGVLQQGPDAAPMASEATPEAARTVDTEENGKASSVSKRARVA